MYIVFRCDCGYVLYCKNHYKTHKCPYCNKTLSVKSRRILLKHDNVDIIRGYVNNEMDKIYGNTDFIKGNELK